MKTEYCSKHHHQLSFLAPLYVPTHRSRLAFSPPLPPAEPAISPARSLFRPAPPTGAEAICPIGRDRGGRPAVAADECGGPCVPLLLDRERAEKKPIPGVHLAAQPRLSRRRMSKVQMGLLLVMCEVQSRRSVRTADPLPAPVYADHGEAQRMTVVACWVIVAR